MSEPPPRTHRHIAAAFVHRLEALPLQVNKDHVVDDLIWLRTVFGEVSAFETAVSRVREELAALTPHSKGRALDGRLRGWLKRRFPSGPDDTQQVMWLIFRVRRDGVELLAFGDRLRPGDFYDYADARLRL